MKTLGVVTNPASNQGRGALTGLEVVTLLQEHASRHGFSIVNLTGSNSDDSLQRIEQALDTFDALVVVGGDGMVSLGCNALANTGKPLGIIPSGSGNDFARSLYLPVNRVETAVESVVAAFVHNSHISVDLGFVKSEGEQGFTRYFAGMLACGMDADINLAANQSKLPLGILRYGWAGLHRICNLKDYGYRIAMERPYEHTSQWFNLDTPLLTIANAKFIGSGIQLSPNSSVDDGLMEAIWAVYKPTLRQGLQMMASSYSEHPHYGKALQMQRIIGIHIAASGNGLRPPTIMADGEIVGELPVYVAVAHHALQVLIPPSVMSYWQQEHTAL